MSTSAQVQAAWDAAIFQDATILNITDAIFAFDITTASEAERARLNSGQEVNYIQYTVKRQEAVSALGKLDYTFTVDVQYTRHADPDGENWGVVRDFFDTLTDLVRDELGPSWSSTVDFWRPQEDAAEISQVDFDGNAAWRGTYRFTAFQIVSI